MYAGFTFFLLWAWPQRFTGVRQLLPLLAIIFLGFTLEAIQELGNYGRTFELSDELANIIGFLPGWLFWKIATRFNI